MHRLRTHPTNCGCILHSRCPETTHQVIIRSAAGASSELFSCVWYHDKGAVSGSEIQVQGSHVLFGIGKGEKACSQPRVKGKRAEQWVLVTEHDNTVSRYRSQLDFLKFSRLIIFAYLPCQIHVP